MLTWHGDRPLADLEMIAHLYQVSARTVRRHCTPVQYAPRSGMPRGAGGRALYDALTAGEALAHIAPRPDRTLAALRYRAGQDPKGRTSL